MKLINIEYYRKLCAEQANLIVEMSSFTKEIIDLLSQHENVEAAEKKLNEIMGRANL